MSEPVEPRAVAEQQASNDIPLWRQPEWAERFPWLAQATTGAGAEVEPFDLGLAGSQPVGKVLDRWRQVRDGLGFSSVVHSIQVHGNSIKYHAESLPRGISIIEGFDGHITRMPDLLLSVSIADCVPVFLVGEESQTVSLVHAGWRGTAAGILEDAVGQMKRTGTPADDLWMHCGPAICGLCYEVGPEVHSAVNPGDATPDGPRPIDLRAALARRAWKLGVEPDRISVSAHCTRCGEPPFFSHRAGSAGRQMGLLGLIDPEP